MLKISSAWTNKWKSFSFSCLFNVTKKTEGAFVVKWWSNDGMDGWKASCAAVTKIKMGMLIIAICSGSLYFNNLAQNLA